MRGHSNVQGNRTCGIDHRPTAEFLDRLAEVCKIDPPREHGMDTVAAIQAMHRGDVKVFVGMGGNFALAAPDTAYTCENLRTLVFMNQDDMRERGLSELDPVDITSTAKDGSHRHLKGYLAIPYDIPRGCAAGSRVRSNPRGSGSMAGQRASVCRRSRYPGLPARRPRPRVRPAGPGRGRRGPMCRSICSDRPGAAA